MLRLRFHKQPGVSRPKIHGGVDLSGTVIARGLVIVLPLMVDILTNNRTHIKKDTRRCCYPPARASVMPAYSSSGAWYRSRFEE